MGMLLLLALLVVLMEKCAGGAMGVQLLGGLPAEQGSHHCQEAETPHGFPETAIQPCPANGNLHTHGQSAGRSIARPSAMRGRWHIVPLHAKHVAVQLQGALAVCGVGMPGRCAARWVEMRSGGM